MRNTLFLCNGKAKECKKTNCYKNGGTCRHTSDVRYAENFQKYGEVFQEKQKMAKMFGTNVDYLLKGMVGVPSDIECLRK